MLKTELQGCGLRTTDRLERIYLWTGMAPLAATAIFAYTPPTMLVR